jgi:acyl carrier protein
VVREVVGSALGIAATDVDGGAALSGLGLDSFRAISVRAGIRRRLGVMPALQAMLNHATVAGLVETVIEQYERGARD